MGQGTAQRVDQQNKDASNVDDVLWFVARGNVLKGPYSTSELQGKVRKKEISFMDYCWRQGFREWRPIGSIEDFDRRGRLRALPSYPSVAVPGGGGLPEPSSAGRQNDKKSAGALARAAAQAKESKRFQITLTRNKRHSITIYEWGFAAIFSLVFAYFAADFALKEVEGAFRQKVETLKAGLPQSFGQSSHQLHAGVQAWKPLYSAPGFKEIYVTPPTAFGPEKTLGVERSLPVTVEGFPVRNADGEWQVSGFKIQNYGALPVWEASEFGVEGIFRRPLEVHGSLNPHNLRAIDVFTAGNPFQRR